MAQEREPLFAPVSVGRASSAIADQIRDAIVSGRLAQGERLSPERELAEQFGVSRVTVRDALRGLEALGLVEVRVGARGGAFVRAPTGAQIGRTMSDMMVLAAVTSAEVVEARLMLELGTVTLACDRATADDLAALAASIERGRRELAARTYTRERSWEFHSLLAGAVHNRAVEALTASLRSTLTLQPVRAREGGKGHAATVEEHARVLAALEARSPEQARNAMADHLLRGTDLETRAAVLLDWWRG